MPTHIRFDDNDGSDYEPSESDDDYTENEKHLLKNLKNQQKSDSDSEVEVFNVGPNDSEESDAVSNHSDIALSDIEDEKDDLPDIRAWGKDKRKYYSTDYVDPDYGGFQGKDAELAEIEEAEAKNLQKQLAEQLDDDDFSLDIFKKKETLETKIDEEIIKTDVSTLSKREKLQILKSESPEFFELIQDFEDKMGISREFLDPVLKKYKKGQIPNCAAIDFIQMQHELILNYCTNIDMYLLLKASKVNVQNHPVIKRLYQYRQLLSQLNPVFEKIVKPQIEILLKEKLPEKEIIENEKIITKKLNILKQLAQPKTNKRKQNKEEKSKKKVKFSEELITKSIENYSDNNDVEIDDDDNELEKKQDIEEQSEKRAINYKIAKNKGLTPRRKKEQRNPRVKHRNKFRKAKIRRKGAIREPRHELSRYGGEISGIKTGVTKSIQIKT